MSTAEVDERISLISHTNDAWALAKEIDEAENAEMLYSHVLGRANQGDPQVDLAFAVIKQNFARRNSNPSRFIETLCSHTSRDPELIDILWRYRDWGSREANVATHDEVIVEKIEGGDLSRIFASACGERWGGARVEHIFVYVALTGHYELLEGRLSEVEIVQVFDVNRPILEAELPYLRFNPETRKYELDEEARRTQTPVDVRYQEIVGSPAGPAEGWEGENYVSAGGSTAE